MDKTQDRLLIVDRTEEQSRQFSRIGRRLGYATDTADSLGKFDDALANTTPTVALIDLQSVSDGGLEHLKALRKRACDTRVILTSDNNLRELETAKQLSEFLGLSVVSGVRTSAIVNLVRDELRKATQSRIEIKIDNLKAAVDAGDVRPSYQPRACAVKRRGWMITDVEALPRWRMSANDSDTFHNFLSVAEEAGLLHEITLQLLEQTIAQMDSWRSRRIGLSVATKLPASVLSDTALPDFLNELMRNAGLATSSLTLEISESLAMGFSTAAFDVLNRLKAMGFRLGICEFGTSYSSLEQLYRLRFDELKIDPSLVLESRISGETRTIVEATVLLAQKFGMDVCAAGVDSERTLQYLGRIGCNKAQGTYIGDPLAPDVLEDCIIEWNIVPVAAS